MRTTARGAEHRQHSRLCAAYAREVELPETESVTFVQHVAHVREVGAYLDRLFDAHGVLVSGRCGLPLHGALHEGCRRASIFRTPIRSKRSELSCLECSDPTRFYPPSNANSAKTRCSMCWTRVPESASDRSRRSSRSRFPPAAARRTPRCASLCEHALSDGHNMRRVIYAVPYTSIIEQNAERVSQGGRREQRSRTSCATSISIIDEEAESYKSGDAKKATSPSVRELGRARRGHDERAASSSRSTPAGRRAAASCTISRTA